MEGHNWKNISRLVALTTLETATRIERETYEINGYLWRLTAVSSQDGSTQILSSVESMDPEDYAPERFARWVLPNDLEVDVAQKLARAIIHLPDLVVAVRDGRAPVADPMQPLAQLLPYQRYDWLDYRRYMSAKPPTLLEDDELSQVRDSAAPPRDSEVDAVS